MARSLHQPGSMDSAHAPSSRQACRAVTIGDVMHRDYVAISQEELLKEACIIMRLARLRHLPVEQNGFLVGILSYRDLQDYALQRRAEDERKPGAKVEGAMVNAPYVVTPESSLEEASWRMCQLHIGCLPVVKPTEDGPLLVGVVTETDLLRAAYPLS